MLGSLRWTELIWAYITVMILLCISIYYAVLIFDPRRPSDADCSFFMPSTLYICYKRSLALYCHSFVTQIVSTTRKSVGTSPPPCFLVITPRVCGASGYWRLQSTTPSSYSWKNFISSKTRSAFTISWSFSMETPQRKNTELATGCAETMAHVLFNPRDRNCRLCLTQIRASPSKASGLSGKQRK